jgi:hypothetical protein
MTRAYLLAVAFAPVLGLPAEAGAERRYTDQFTVEPIGELRFNATIDEDDDKLFQLAVAPGIGVFLAKGLEVGFQPQLRLERLDASDDDYTQVYGGAGLFVDYVFDPGSIVFPYVGVGFSALGGTTRADLAGIGGVDYSFNVVEVGPHVGIKILLGRNGILTVGFSYAFQSWGYEDVDDRDDRHLFWVGTGLGFWL